jgi:tRNA threonylcarbamoyl adenosine modification protein (Sua5/YciO/YrdC/YwlC family)
LFINRIHSSLVTRHSSLVTRHRISLAQYFTIHPDNPQPRLIRRAVEIVRAGGVIVYPTDSCYALGCHLGDKSAMERMRAIRQVDARHHFALVCRDLAEIAVYARVDNSQFRLLKSATPGSYTFILKATRELPKRLLHSSRRTIGLRVPDHRVVQALLAELGEPLLSSTLMLPGDELPLNDAGEIRDRLEHAVDLVLDTGSCGITPTTVVDLTGEAPVITRVGRGRLEPFGLPA